MIEGDGAGTEKDEGEGEGGQSEGEFVAALAHQSVVEVYFGDGDGEIDADGDSSAAREQANEYEQGTKKLDIGGEIAHPGGQAEAGDELGVVVKSAENLVVSVAKHDRAQSEAHDKEREGLQAV